MRRRDFYWSLFQKNEKRQINDLRTEYVEVAYEVLPKADHDNWLIWREGFRSWKPLADFPALLKSLREAGGSTGEQPPAPKISTVADNHRTSVQTRLERANANTTDLGGDLEFSEESEHNERDMRYPKKWEVRINAGGAKALVNQTVDVSMRGLRLRDPLPRGLPNYFNVELRFYDQVIALVCSEMKTPDGSASHKLRIDVNQQPGVLQSALIAQN